MSSKAVFTVKNPKKQTATTIGNPRDFLLYKINSGVGIPLVFNVENLYATTLARGVPNIKAMTLVNIDKNNFLDNGVERKVSKGEEKVHYHQYYF
jgi:hypothetical protein